MSVHKGEIEEKYESEHVKLADNNDAEKTSLMRENERIENETTFHEKMVNMKSSITVEPTLILFVMPCLFSMIATQNLILEKACRVNFNYSDEICTALKKRETQNYTIEEANVQTLVASTLAWRSIIQTVLPTILLLFAGAWSDATGKRKILIMLPIIGEFATSISNIICTYFFESISVEVTVLMETMCPSIIGGWSFMFLGVFSYIGDITSKESRTFRIGVLNMCMTIGIPIGIGLSGISLRIFGYYGVFSTSAMLLFINFIYTLFMVKDRSRNTNNTKVSMGVVDNIKLFFDLKQLKNTLSIMWKKGPNNRRIKIILLLTIACLLFGVLWGELSMTYLNLRYRFNWDEISYSFYSTYNISIHTLGTLFSLTVFSKYLQWDDTVLGLIATHSKICGALLSAFAVTGWMFCLAPVVEVFSGTSQIALRSLASKSVPSDELGKIYSLYGLSETMMPLLFGPLYSKVYIATLDVMPGAIFLMTAATMCVASVIFWYLFYKHRQEMKKTSRKIDSNVNLS